MIRILDCTLRDGGYYTNWDFSQELVDEYCATAEVLPLDYVEVGYRSIAMKDYLGKYFYCPLSVLADLKSKMPSKKLAIILNEKDIRQEHLDEVLGECYEYISLVRMAVSPDNFLRALRLAEGIKAMGYEVAFNVMYMSSWNSDSAFLENMGETKGLIDLFYMVDSYGGILPHEVKDTIDLIKSRTDVPLGFHGHNNMEMALANTITAIEHGCDIVDATITGMGRGAGNLRTELLLIYLASRQGLNIPFNSLSQTVDSFEKLRAHHGWGTQLPYIFSGAFSLPQKQVMEWVGMNRYSLGNIVNALKNQKDSVDDNIKLPALKTDLNYNKAIIIGGGPTIELHNEAILSFAQRNKDACLILAGAKNASHIESLDKGRYYALSGFESEKLLKSVSQINLDRDHFVFPPYPRKMGTVIPDSLRDNSMELNEIRITSSSADSPLVISLQIALDLGVKEIYLAGFDGYDAARDRNQFMLAIENQRIIDDFQKIKEVRLVSITPTRYKNLPTRSIYNLI